ncbi:MAG: tyrosine-protein phosphatase, partial [Candidatus Eremiobacterota bacterium]
NVPNMGVLSRSVIRGGQPREAGFSWLKSQGVDTIVNLRREAHWEEKAAARHGLRYVFLAMPVFDAPTMDLVYRFLQIVTDPANGTIFFHCYHGSDRTGTLAAVYRIAVQGWSVADAVEEFYRHGFHAGYHDRNLEFLYRFETHWRGLPDEERMRLTNREPVPQA